MAAQPAGRQTLSRLCGLSSVMLVAAAAYQWQTKIFWTLGHDGTLAVTIPVLLIAAFLLALAAFLLKPY